MLKISYSGLLLLVCISCNRCADSKNEKLDQLANQECQAIDLNMQRFLIADLIRLSQDTLVYAKSKSDSDRINNRLKILLNKKNELLKESLLLADTIRLQLDTLLPYTDKQDDKQFTVSL